MSKTKKIKIFETKNEVSQALHHYRSVGFVPTMGALHEGHLSLIEQSCRENEITVASIFVNPTQFNSNNDLVNYPRSLDTDIEMLAAAGCNCVFVPSVAEMYPVEDKRIFDFGMLDKVMEGALRPGHFNGVAQIVSKLFDVVNPDRAYFGEKDFQQLAIIKRLTAMMNYRVQIVACPTVREADGLAMSSRNTRLTPEQRQNASIIARTLFACKEKVKIAPFDDLKKWATEQIDSVPEMKIEYFEIVNRNTLQTAYQYEKDTLQACIAARVGAVRLIDNIRL